MTSRFQVELARTVPPRPARELLRGGTSRHVLDGPRWRASARGWYVPASVARTPAQRIIEAAALLPDGGAVGGWAAAYAWGVDWLDGLHRSGRRLPVPLVVPPTVRRRSTPGVRWVRDPRLQLIPTRDLPLTGLADAGILAARSTGSVEDALVVLDAVLARGLVGLDVLRFALEASPDRRDRHRVAAALRLASVGVLSPQESRLRFCWVVEAGLPPPLVNPPLVDLDGRWLGQPDLFDPDAGLAGEFDGAVHRDRIRHHRDNHREERVENANTVVVRADGLDLGRGRTPLVARLRTAAERGRRRNRADDRWRVEAPSWWTIELTDAEKAAMYG